MKLIFVLSCKDVKLFIELIKFICLIWLFFDFFLIMLRTCPSLIDSVCSLIYRSLHMHNLSLPVKKQHINETTGAKFMGYGQATKGGAESVDGRLDYFNWKILLATDVVVPLKFAIINK